jgi:hypothetical protein
MIKINITKITNLRIFLNSNYISHNSKKKARHDSDQTIDFFLSQTEGDGEGVLQSMLLNHVTAVRRPRVFMSTVRVIQLLMVPGASPSTLLTSDSGLNQKPHGLRPNAYTTRPCG